MKPWLTPLRDLVAPPGFAAAALLALAALVGGCASTPPAPSAAALLHDDLFAAPSAPVDKDAIFRLSPAMQRFTHEVLAPQADNREPRRALIAALYSQRQLRLQYDSEQTRTAEEAFDARAGNCLSLVIMTAAFAKQMGLPVSYQSVRVDDFYTRQGDLMLASGHVNLVLERLPPRANAARNDQEDLTVDFLSASEMRGQRTVPLAESTIVAMFLNNRAAEAVTAGHLDDAYAWARAAVLHEPGFHAAINTLGVVYLRRSLLPEAEAALRFALEAEPDNTAALSNLSLALRRQGRNAEADAAAARLAQLQPVAPFHYYELGRKAMEAGQYQQAAEQFARELRRQPFQPDVHFWAAQAYWRLGDVERAQRHLRDAVTYSTTVGTQKQYAAKLERLKSAQVH